MGGRGRLHRVLASTPITQAESGFMSLNGFADGPPGAGPDRPAIDMVTGMAACNAILMALFARDRLGRGQHVEGGVVRHCGGNDRVLRNGLFETGKNF